jgi:hypothetical protein
MSKGMGKLGVCPDVGLLPILSDYLIRQNCQAYKKYRLTIDGLKVRLNKRGDTL